MRPSERMFQNTPDTKSQTKNPKLAKRPMGVFRNSCIFAHSQGQMIRAHHPLNSVSASHAEILDIEGLFAQGSRSGRTFGESVGGILEMESSVWSNGIRHHVFYTRPDTE